MPWQMYLALVGRAGRFSARHLYHAMTAHLWALRAQYHDHAAGEHDRIRRAAFANVGGEQQFALKQSPDA